ncbi:MAG: RagB/SusD family nutrient uptake outer membrane protein [Chitinophagaceae bacterium]|jgi:starch-binding outer membrane protein, SusD/RagB family|nr:RagB/SusD family nutrient uptake outer membrane protein [Chitinophagaceae bacterium]
MKTFSKIFTVSALCSSMLLAASCNIDPELGANNVVLPPPTEGAPAAPSIGAVYSQLNNLVGQYGYQALQEHSTDELLGPTRGTDWDDFGTWRRLHLHTWGPDHNQINDVWSQVNGALFQTTLAAELLSGQAKAEGQFLRSYFRMISADLFGVVQSRPATAPSRGIPNVIPRAAAIDTIIAELESAVAGLPTFNGTNKSVATKEAAWALLAKCYLNKAVYKASATTPAGPYTFAAADMNKVIQYCDLIDANPLLEIDANYWDNFKWDNGTASSENIFVRKNSDGINVVWATNMGGHYNQTPSGWNGFTTLSNFYDSFEDGDIRKKDTVAGILQYNVSPSVVVVDSSIYFNTASGPRTSYNRLTGINAGFLVGQVQGPQSQKIGQKIVNLKDRSGNPLVLTKNVSPFFNSEVTGIRTNKFPLDPSTINDGGWGSANDFPFFRFADVRLMKAEAILRGGTGTNGETALSIVAGIRSQRGITTTGTMDLPKLLAERGREIYLEGWRRNDLIRFGAFNNPTQGRTAASEGYKVVYPIPTIALSSNPNLKQNFGY